MRKTFSLEYHGNPLYIDQTFVFNFVSSNLCQKHNLMVSSKQTSIRNRRYEIPITTFDIAFIESRTKIIHEDILSTATSAQPLTFPFIFLKSCLIYINVFFFHFQVHTQTLQTENSMLFLHTAALTKDGGHLVLANYDESIKTSYVTLWDCVTGEIKRRLRNEANVAALAITDDASRVLIGHSLDELHIWDPMKPNSLRRIRGRDEGSDRGGGGGGGNSVLNFEGALGGDANGGMNSACQMFIVEDGARAIVFAGDVSVWDLDRGTMLAAFSPDTRVTACKVLLDGALTLFGMYDKPELVILRLSGTGAKFQALDSGSSDDGGVELFGETTGDTSDEDEDEDEDEDGENGQAD